jgi:hypothetical protein
MPARIVHAPFTAAEVESLNGYQHSLAGHPFTCPGAHADRGEVVLVAHEGGWRCPRDCGYAQTWAHEFMTDGSWRETAAEIKRVLSPDSPGHMNPCSRCSGSGSEPADGGVTVSREDLRAILRMASDCPEAIPVSPDEDAVLVRLGQAAS